MNAQILVAEEQRIRNAVERAYCDPTGNSLPIYDGMFNVVQYASSSPRILWVLKEPYDGGAACEGGDWILTGDSKSDEISRWRAFQPICYINYGIWKGEHDWNNMPWLRDSEEIRFGLKKTALINISKLPGLKTSPRDRIVAAYQRHRELILDQIRTYSPNIIFACDPHANLILREFGFAEPQWQWFESAASVQVLAEQRLVWVGHPSSRANRAAYINNAIKAATDDFMDKIE